MKLKTLITLSVSLLVALTLMTGCKQEQPAPKPAPEKAAAKPAEEKKDPLAAWKPTFDPSGAEYTYLLSNVSHPVIEGVGAGYRIRDAVWEKSGGRLYVDFRPLSQLGGEKDVIAKLKLGAIQGMLSSSVAAANVADKLGIVNVPYVIDTFEKLDTFRATPELWDEFVSAPQECAFLRTWSEPRASSRTVMFFGWNTTFWPLYRDQSRVRMRPSRSSLSKTCVPGNGV